MSRENVELVHRVFDAFNRRDLEAFLLLMHEDIEVGTRLAAVEGLYRGHEGIHRWWADLFSVLPDYVIEVFEVNDLGEVVLARASARGHGAGSATPVNEPFWWAGRWRDQRCVSWRSSSTKTEALEAMGLEE